MALSYELSAHGEHSKHGVLSRLTPVPDDGIVVVRVRQAVSIKETMVNFSFSEWKKDVLESAADRFERRLSEETGLLRVDVTRMEVRLIRWMFVFWLGQLGVTLSAVALILRAN